MQTPTPLSREERIEIADQIYAHFESIMVNLYTRWQSEKGFEHFDGYIEVVRNEMTKSFPSLKFVGMKNTPFQFVVEIGGIDYRFTIKRGQYSWARLEAN